MAEAMQRQSTQEVARAFISESDEQRDMSDFGVPYLGSNPDRAFLIGSPSTKIVDGAGDIAYIPTTTFVGGVIYALAETGGVNSEDWPQERVIELGIQIGMILGARRENDRLFRVGSQAFRSTAQGAMLNGTDFQRILAEAPTAVEQLAKQVRQDRSPRQ